MTHAPSVIAAVDLNAKAKGVIARAARLAATSHLDLVIAHGIDPHPVFESDHIPVSSRTEIQAEEDRHGRAWLVGLAHHLGLTSFEVVVLRGRPADAVADLVRARGARFVVMGRPAWGPLSSMAGLAADPRLRAVGCAVLTGVEAVDDPARGKGPRPGWVGRKHPPSAA